MKQGRGITLLVPFTPGVAADRDRTWEWLTRYWRTVLPYAQVVLGGDQSHPRTPTGLPFCKTAAVNDAAERATGDVLVILDADAYVPAEVILHAAREIRYARDTGRRLWFVPYRRFWRLSRDTTELVLRSDPRDPWRPHDPPPLEQLDSQNYAAGRYGHHFAAMIMVMPREAFDSIGGMDPRFDGGWGAEDISFMRAVDTVYSPHKTTDRSVYHLHHGTIGLGIDRRWAGQTRSKPFTVLGSRYLAAYGDPARMLRLTAEWRIPTNEGAHELPAPQAEAGEA